MKNGKSKISLIAAGLLIVSLFLGGCYSSNAVSVVQTTAAVETKLTDDVETEGEKNTIETTELTVEELGGFVLSVSCGYGKYAKYGRDMGVQATIINHGEDFVGELWILIPKDGSGSQSNLFRKEFSIASGEEKTIELAIPVLFSTGKLNISIRDEKEKEKASVDVRVNVQGDEGVLYVGVLSDNYMDLSYLTDSHTKTFFVEGEDFPENKKGLDMLDILVINDFNTGNFNASQYEALKGFVNEGGTLVLGTGATGMKTLEIFKDDFLTGSAGKVESQAVSLGSSGKKIEKEILNITLDNGSVVYKENEIPLMEKVNAGNGNIQLFAFDLGLSSNEWNTMGKHILSKITDNLSQTKKLQLSGEAGRNQNFYQLRNCLEMLNTDNVPSVGKYAAALGMYLILIGPGLYLVLKKLDKRQFTWLIVPGLAVIFSLTIYFMGSDTRLSKPYAQYITFAHISEGVESEELTFSLTAPYNNAYQVTVPAEYDVTLPVMDYYYGNYSYDKGSLEYDMSISYGAEVTTLGIRNHGAFEPAYFSADSVKKAEGSVESKISMKELTDGELTYTGSVTNNLGYDLESAVLVVDSHYIVLGSLTNGETRQIDGLQSYVLNSQDDMWNYGIIELIIGGDPWVNGRDNEKLRQYYALEYKLTNDLQRQEKANYLLGFTEDSSNPVIEATGLKNAGIKVVTAAVEVDHRISDKQEYVPSLDNRYVVLNGDYDSVYRYIYSDSLELEVHFAEDEVISSIAYPKSGNSENDPKIAHNGMGYYGTIEAFNYETEQYEQIFESGKPDVLEEVAPYLNEDNTMRLIFQIDEKARNYYSISVPLLTATKEVE